jgi:hypothetical protein
MVAERWSDTPRDWLPAGAAIVAGTGLPVAGKL